MKFFLLVLTNGFLNVGDFTIVPHILFPEFSMICYAPKFKNEKWKSGDTAPYGYVCCKWGKEEFLKFPTDSILFGVKQ